MVVGGGGGELVHNGGGGALYWCNRYNTMQCNAKGFHDLVKVFETQI